MPQNDWYLCILYAFETQMREKLRYLFVIQPLIFRGTTTKCQKKTKEQNKHEHTQ